MTAQEYVRRSADWAEKVEFINGRAYAMSGGSARHAAVSMNIGVALSLALRGSGCRATSSDQRLFVEATGAYLYPDISVICGRYRAPVDDPHSVTNPIVVVEVLSPSTREHDLSSKFEHYRHLPSVQHVLYIEPDRRHVIHHQRTPEGWLRRDVTQGAVVLGDLATLTLDAIYAELDQVTGP